MSNFRRRLIMSVKKEDEYTELEYLETTGTQYINTEIKTKQSLKVEYTFSGKAQGKLHFGARKNTDEDGLTFGFTKTASCYCGFGGSTKEYSCNVNTIDGSKHTVVLSNEMFTIDDISQTQPERTTFKNFYDIYLFTWNNANTPDKRRFVGKAYDFRIYDRDVLIQHLVPALDSNNTPCMYDKVNSKFYYNSGTGDFLYGEKEV